MNWTEFYITLPSNVKSFADNTMASYGTILPRALKLEGEWYVALTEISFTKSWYTLYEPVDLNYECFYGEIPSRIRFEPGHFASASDLIEKLLTTYADFLGKAHENLMPKIEIGPGGIVSLGSASLDSMVSFLPEEKIGESVANSALEFDNCFASLGEELSNILGLPWPLPFSREIFESGDYKIRGLRPADIKAGRHSLYVYSDIVEPSTVGDFEVQFLRNITVPDSVRYGEQCDVVLSNPYYFKVHQNELNRIFINIKDGSGRAIGFNFGRVIVTLHFKKKWTNII